ncbi:MAG: hypothetical protein M0Z89_06065 [Nitrospiraceae bacterium]|nr:hypothetical protein [Nitrospiraceae bacterium]
MKKGEFALDFSLLAILLRRLGRPFDPAFADAWCQDACHENVGMILAAGGL